MRIGVAGIGAVGADVARSLDRGDVPGCGLSGIAARTIEKAAALNETLRQAGASARLRCFGGGKRLCH